MTKKQLSYIHGRHSSHLKLGEVAPPSIEQFIRRAIVKGEKLKLKRTEEIVELCRNKIADGGYGHSEIKIHQLFASCPSFDKATSLYQVREKKRKKLLEDYLKEAQPLIDRAELSELSTDITPEEIIKELHDAAAPLREFANTWPTKNKPDDEDDCPF